MVEFVSAVDIRQPVLIANIVRKVIIVLMTKVSLIRGMISHKILLLLILLVFYNIHVMTYKKFLIYVKTLLILKVFIGFMLYYQFNTLNFLKVFSRKLRKTQ